MDPSTYHKASPSEDYDLLCHPEIDFLTLKVQALLNESDECDPGPLDLNEVNMKEHFVEKSSKEEFSRETTKRRDITGKYIETISKGFSFSSNLELDSGAPRLDAASKSMPFSKNITKNEKYRQCTILLNQQPNPAKEAKELEGYLCHDMSDVTYNSHIGSIYDDSYTSHQTSSIHEKLCDFTELKFNSIQSTNLKKQGPLTQSKAYITPQSSKKLSSKNYEYNIKDTEIPGFVNRFDASYNFRSLNPKTNVPNKTSSYDLKKSEYKHVNQVHWNINENVNRNFVVSKNNSDEKSMHIRNDQNSQVKSSNVQDVPSNSFREYLNEAINKRLQVYQSRKKQSVAFCIYTSGCQCYRKCNLQAAYLKHFSCHKSGLNKEKHSRNRRFHATTSEKIIRNSEKKFICEKLSDSMSLSQPMASTNKIYRSEISDTRMQSFSTTIGHVRKTKRKTIQSKTDLKNFRVYCNSVSKKLYGDRLKQEVLKGKVNHSRSELISNF